MMGRGKENETDAGMNVCTMPPSIGDEGRAAADKKT
jgi:hypothetical protein